MSIQPETVVSVVGDVLHPSDSEQPEVVPAVLVSLTNQHLTLQHKAMQPVEKPQIVTELIIEEISIDGMCGVY